MLALARFVSTRNKIYKLDIDDRELTKEVESDMFALLDLNYSLWNVEPQKIFDSPPIQRNYTLHNNNLKRAYSLASEVLGKTTNVLPGTTTKEAVIQNLHYDILKEVTLSLSIKALHMFRQTSKQFYAFTNQHRGKFWQEYYFKHFSCVPGDLYALTELTFGLKLMNTLTSNEALSSSFWQEIVTNSCQARKVIPDYYPPRDYPPFKDVIYRDYPQLIGSKYTEHTFDYLHPHRNSLKTKTAPYSFIWFLAYVNSNCIYHMGFEQLHDGTINGILFQTPDFSESWENRFQYMRHIVEWMTASSKEEFAVKAKPLLEKYLMARNNGYYSINWLGPIIKLVPTMLEEAIGRVKTAVRSINEDIDKSAKLLCTKLNINHLNSWQFIKTVEHLTTQFKQWTNFPLSDFDKQRQQFTSRPDIKSNYPYKSTTNSLVNNNCELSLELDGDGNFDSASKVRRQIGFAPVAVMKLYRVLLNWILMPILRTLWPSDLNHYSFELRPFMLQQDAALLLYRQLYMDSNCFVPFSFVSVGRAYPANWPVAAHGFALHYLKPIIAVVDGAVESKITRKPNENYSINALLRVIEFNPLLPEMHIKNLNRLLTAVLGSE